MKKNGDKVADVRKHEMTAAKLAHIIPKAAVGSAKPPSGHQGGAGEVEHVISYALNHMVAPRRSFAELLELATSLGLDQVEIRNDLDGVPMRDGTPPDRVRAEAEAAGVRILSINALQRFNDWNDARAGEATALARYARGCGAEALVLCPVNDANYRLAEPERLTRLRAALRALAPILEDAGIMGLVEPLGFATELAALQGGCDRSDRGDSGSASASASSTTRSTTTSRASRAFIRSGPGSCTSRASTTPICRSTGCATSTGSWST